MSAALPWLQEHRPAGVSRLHAEAGEILERCRGEGPANCQGRCPLGVDARGYVQLTHQGRFAEALQVVRERAPFPGILGYVCAHPCELHCKRIDQDEAVRIRDIKRFLAEWETGEPRHLVECAPASGKRVAVVGAGPAGLLAAHDLRRAGHEVTVLEAAAEIGGCLVDKIPDWRLPRGVVARDLSVIAALGITVTTGVTVGRDVTLEELEAGHDAVVLATGFAAMAALLGRTSGGLRPTPRGTLAVDPLTCATERPGVFAAGDGVSGPSTVVHAMAQGRRAAESVRRVLAGADLRDGRDEPLPGRLLWSLEIDEAERKRRERTPTMLVPALPPMTEEAAREEAGRCLDCQCGLCVKDCEFLAQHCLSPKDLARRVLAGVEEPLKAVYSCNVCSLCAAVCPERLDTGEMLLEARREAVRAGLGPLPQHKPIISYYKAGVSKTFGMVMAEPGRRRSKRLFFTGCALPAVSPANTLFAYDELRRGYPGTGALMWCCGAPAELLGMEEAFEHGREQLLRMAESVGAEELVAACPDCLHTLKTTVPELRITTVWELLAESWKPERIREGARIAIHDSCKGRHEPGMHAAVRALLTGAGGLVEDVEYAGEKARCCGAGGMMYPVDPQLSQKITDRRAAESELPMITYCAGCRMALRSRGKDAIHLLDFLRARDWEKTAHATATGSIARYANRLRTKLTLRRLKPLAGTGRPS